MSAPPYVELHCHSNFSFLDGGSHPYELAMRAAELEIDGEELVMIARNLAGYSRLCRLLSVAHHDQAKGEARGSLHTVSEHRGDLFYLTATDDEKRLRSTQEALGRDVVFSELHHHMSPEDAWILEGRAAMAR